MKKSKIIFTFLIFFFLSCMILQPARFLQASLDGLSAWTFNVLPSVLPFMFFTRVLSSLDTMSALTKPFSSVTNKLFRTPPISLYTFFMAVLSGYPVGSKMVADQFMQGQITKEDAFKMTSFCSTSGPMFIIGAVGIGMFSSAKIGYILFFSHVIGAFLNGIIFRNYKISRKKNKPEEKPKQAKTRRNQPLARLRKSCIFKRKKREKDGLKKSCLFSQNDIEKQQSLQNWHTPQNSLAKKTLRSVQEPYTSFEGTAQTAAKTFSQKEKDKDFSLSDIVLSSAQSILSVGCIITIFFIVIECFSPIFSLFPSPISEFLAGLIEITKGCISLSALSGNLRVVLCSFVISFGGISTIMQSLAMLEKIGMPVKLFVTQKFSHAVLSALVTIFLLAVA